MHTPDEHYQEEEPVNDIDVGWFEGWIDPFHECLIEPGHYMAFGAMMSSKLLSPNYIFFKFMHEATMPQEVDL